MTAPTTAASTTAPATGDLVVLVDDAGTPIGTAPRLTVHDSDTPLHLAFSLHLVDEVGRTLLTRRALTKRTWPGVWTNSCCGHPRPGESPARAAVRRVLEELGVSLSYDDVRVALPDFRYRAVDASGVVEHEICPVHLARVPSGLVPSPDPHEVAEHAWVPWPAVHAAVGATPFAFSPWLVEQALAIGPTLPGHDVVRSDPTTGSNA